MSKKRLLSALFITMFLGMVESSYALPVVNYTNTYDSGSGIWKYESTIFNNTSDLLFDYFIEPTVEPLAAADLTSAGWSLDLGTNFVHWMADFGLEILPDGTMGGFWFTYNGSPLDNIGPLAYTVVLWDSVVNDSYAISGVTIASSSVPESETIILFVTGILGLAVLKSRKSIIQSRNEGSHSLLNS